MPRGILIYPFLIFFDYPDRASLNFATRPGFTHVLSQPTVALSFSELKIIQVLVKDLKK